MKKSNLFLVLLVIILSTIVTSMYARVYSVVDSQKKVIGTEDCWMVKYSLYEDHGTMDTKDDTKIGSYTTLVGDCDDDDDTQNFLNNININKTTGYSIYPNPVIDYLNISFTDERESDHIKWIIYNLTGDKVNSGSFDFENNGSDVKTINANFLYNGPYILKIIDGPKVTLNKIVISK